MTATAVVGSAAEDTTPSEREAPQRFAWWHPRSADLGRHKARREEHARRNDIWARSPAQEEAPVIRRPLPPPSAPCVFAVLDGPVFAPVDPRPIGGGISILPSAIMNELERIVKRARTLPPE